MGFIPKGKIGVLINVVVSLRPLLFESKLFDNLERMDITWDMANFKKIKCFLTIQL